MIGGMDCQMLDWVLRNAREGSRIGVMERATRSVTESYAMQKLELEQERLHLATWQRYLIEVVAGMAN